MVSPWGRESRIKKLQEGVLVSQKVMSSSLSQVRSNMPACATENAHTDTHPGCHGLTSREAPFEPSGYLVKSVWGITVICGRIPLPSQLASELIIASTSCSYNWPRVAFAEQTHCALHSVLAGLLFASDRRIWFCSKAGTQKLSCPTSHYI